MAFYTYKITRDYGFAPNPFFGYCTLACCKPRIRNRANVGDWILGTGAVENNLLFHLIFMMNVTEKCDFNSYWNDTRFVTKRPVINGSLKQMHGDNIYHHVNGKWYQADSHHSLENGVVNELNMKQDLSGTSVLVSTDFVYLGKNHYKIPARYKELFPNRKQRDYIKVTNTILAMEFVNLIKSTYSPGFNGDPNNWIEYSDYLQLKLF